MGLTYFTEPLLFIIDTLFYLYIVAVLLRFLLQWTNANYYNPISQFLVKITHPPLKILRRFIPPIGKIDTSSIILAVALQLSSNFFVLLLKGLSVGLAALIVISISQLITLLLNIFIFAIFAQAILSWFNPYNNNPVFDLLTSLTEPVLSVCRKLIPDLGGLDLSPLAALMLLQLAKMMLIPPLQELARLIG